MSVKSTEAVKKVSDNAAPWRRFMSKYRDFIIFCIIGVITGVIYFISIFLLYGTLNFDYRIAVSLSYALAVIVHFFANRHITFKNSGDRIDHQIIKYAAMIGLNYLTTMAIVIASVGWLEFSVYASAVLAILMNLLTNYLMLKYWIFRIKKHTAVIPSPSKPSETP